MSDEPDGGAPDHSSAQDATSPGEATSPGQLPVRPPHGSGDGSGTDVLPPVADSPSTTTPRWSARAKVPTPEPDPDGAQVWAEPLDLAPRGATVAILIVMCVILLTALAGLGTWLALRGRGQVPPPGPTVSAPVTPTRSSTVGASSSASATPTATIPVGIAIPDLAGQEYSTAVTTLTGLGFVVERVDEVNNQVPPGSVIRTDPAAGTPVFPGATVTVVVSAVINEPSPSDQPSSPPPP